MRPFPDLHVQQLATMATGCVRAIQHCYHEHNAYICEKLVSVYLLLHYLPWFKHCFH